MSRFQRMVYRIVRRIPAGKVTNYGTVAALAGQPRAARGVGWVLHQLEPDTDVPWWRVVNRNGEISLDRLPPMGRIQRALLQREGVHFDEEGRISDPRYWWDPFEA